MLKIQKSGRGSFLTATLQYRHHKFENTVLLTKVINNSCSHCSTSDTFWVKEILMHVFNFLIYMFTIFLG